MTDPLYAEALDTFGQLLAQATASGMADPNAMSLATATSRASPHTARPGPLSRPASGM